jgi:hypothetical protein
VEQCNTEPDRVLPTVVATRGTIPKSTVDSLNELNIGDCGSSVMINLLALQNSTEIYHTFMDYNAPAA